MMADTIGERVDSKGASKAFQAIIDFSNSRTDDHVLFNSASSIYCQLTLFKIPDVNNKRISVKLPHPLDIDPKDVCIFVKDIDKKTRDYDDTKKLYAKMFEKAAISNPPDIIPLKQLKLEYKPYEAKRKLCDMYALFLADKRIVHLLMRGNNLGKAFFKKKKIPVGITVEKHDHLKEEFESILSSTVLTIAGTGTICNCKIATASMSSTECVANLFAFLSQIEKHLPGGWKNIKSIYVKNQDNKNPVSLPVYYSDANPNEVEVPKAPKRKNEPIVDELTTLRHGNVKVYPSGFVQVVGSATGDSDDDDSEDEDSEGASDEEPVMGESEDSSPEHDGGKQSGGDSSDESEKKPAPRGKKRPPPAKSAAKVKETTTTAEKSKKQKKKQVVSKRKRPKVLL